MNLKYLNAVNILVSAKIGALQKITDSFDGDFERAWHSKSLKRFLPADAPIFGKIDPEKEWDKLAKEKIEIITILDRDYPKPLRHIADPPFLLYIKGSRKVLKNDCLAVVGTRNLTEYGKRVVSLIVEPLVQAGLTIVSGLAMGIDGLAHQAAVKMNAPTIAVLGGGLSNSSIVIQNRKLAGEILQKNGAIITEYPLGTPGSQFSFPQRNRIISGLSKGVLVVEADEKSGSLITAKCALDQNRDVFAVPGSIFSSKSKGPNQLIASGAKVVTDSSAILTEYNIDSTVRQLALTPANKLEEDIINIIGKNSLGLDEIIRATKKDTPEIISCIMNMELENKIINLGNNRFSIK
ncbi:MAG: DNA-processing protein DprA [bacterium]|nr:DNA-processing protein DprA [bacterium]